MVYNKRLFPVGEFHGDDKEDVKITVNLAISKELKSDRDHQLRVKYLQWRIRETILRERLNLFERNYPSTQ